MGGDMRLRYEGLIVERLPSGNLRYRVRVEGDVNRKITLAVNPDHDGFHAAYRAARAGERISPKPDVAEPKGGTLEWLGRAYLAHLASQVKAHQASALTLKQRRNQISRLLKEKSTTGKSVDKAYAGLPMMIPRVELVALRDRKAATPGEARNLFKTIRAMYAWAEENEHCDTNPAKAVKVAYESKGGAAPWSVEDLKKYRERHEPGTTAHLALTLFMFSAARRGDACRLGRRNEIKREGIMWLDWQPEKKGSRFVSIPILPPLLKATRAGTVIGDAYLLTEYGKPFASGAALGNKFRQWCIEAGLPDRSSHGIRKAAGHLLALAGATQYEIMAVHGHANASTSQVYTQAVERIRLGGMAGAKLAGMDW